MSSTLTPRCHRRFHDSHGRSNPTAIGHSKEAGLKAEVLDGRISGTLTYYDMKTDGIAVFGGVLPSGQNYLIPIGFVTQKGWEGDLQLKLTRNWQLVGNYYHGKVQDQTGLPGRRFVHGDVGLLFSLRIPGRSAQGFRVWRRGRAHSGKVVASAGITLPAGQTAPHDGKFFDVKPGTHATAFASYTVNKNLQLRLSVDNLFDKLYAMGLNAAYLVDPSPRRNGTFSISTSSEIST